MKVLFLNYEFPPLGGGAGNASKYLMQEFSKYKDLEIDFITSSIGDFEVEKIGKNITIFKLPIGKDTNNVHSQSRLDIIKYTFKAFFFSRKLILKNKYDLSHSFFTVPCGFLSYLFKILYKIPYIISLRGADVPGYTERFKFLYFFVKPLVKIIWNNSYKVISNSDGLREIAFKTDKNQEIGVIPNGIDIEEFFPDYKNKTENDVFRILFVSRLCPRKGALYAIKAIKKLIEMFPQRKIESIFVGGGEMKDELVKFTEENKLGEKIKFCGSLKHEELSKVYQSADVFLFPSLNEGMSNSLLEALASGLPVIVTNVGGTEELIKNGVNGLVVPLRNIEAITESLEKMMNNSDLRMQMSEENRKKAESMSWKSVSDGYVVFYKNISV